MQSSLCCRESLVCVVGSVRGPLGEWTLYVLCRHQTCQKCMIPWIQLNKSDLAYDSPHSHSPHQPPPPLVLMRLAAKSESATGGHTGRTGHYCCALQREFLAVLLLCSLDHPLQTCFSFTLSSFAITLHPYRGAKAKVGPDLCSPETQTSRF